MQINVKCDVFRPLYTGFAPALITFYGHIGAPGLSKDVEIKYRWVRSDGAHSGSQSITLGPHRWGMPVKTTWTLGLPNYHGWVALEVLTPSHILSEKAAFTVRCADVRAPFQSLGACRNITRDVLLILQDPRSVDAAGNPTPVPTTADLQNLFADIQSYFNENSWGLFRLQLAGVVGPYPLQNPWSHYTRFDSGDADNDGWENQFHERYPEAIRAAAGAVNFSAFDRNGDGILSPDDLTIVIVTPGTYARGFVRPALASEHPWSPLVVNGVTFTDVIDMYTNTPPFTNDTRGGLAHELAHVLLGHTDLYFEPPFNPPDSYQPFRAGSYSLMDRDDGFFHLDALAKLKFGWVTRTLVMQKGTYTIRDVETAHQVHVLAHNDRGTSEYFILENRSASQPSWDRALPDSGLAIWQVIEDATLYGDMAPPPGVPAADWAAVPTTDWGRRAIRLLRADSSRPLNDARALWHGPDHPDVDLHWTDGRIAFQLRSISPAGSAMQYTLV